MPQKKRILFVCLGNICRSPLAHAVFEELVRAHPDPAVRQGFEVESAGTDGWHAGEQADRRMRRTAKSHGVVIDHRAQQATKQDLRTYDLVVAMDRSNRSGLRRLAEGVDGAPRKIRLLREWEPDGPVEADVPDPYYGGERGFEEVFDIVRRCCRRLLDELSSGA